MGPILVLSLILQIGCAVHVVRTGRPLYWIFIVLIGSYIGVLVYLFAVVLPELGSSRTARRAVSGLRDQVDPWRRQRAAERQLAVADTQDNRRRLAEQCLDRGDHAGALALYESSLTGLYATDPELLLGMARAQLELGRAADARDSIERLIAANPGWHAYEGHLLYARAKAAADDLDGALEEYRALVAGFPGEEARVRHAQLLHQAGRGDEARKLFEEVVKRSSLAPAYYRREQREWIAIAKAALG